MKWICNFLFEVVLVSLLLVAFSCSEDINVLSDNSPLSSSDSLESFNSTSTQLTILVSNPGNNNDIKPNLEAAIKNATNGNVIVIPEGTFKFTGKLVITKRISIKGQGADKTILYRPESLSDASLNYLPMISFETNSDISSNIMIWGICFKSKTPSLVSGDGKSLAKDMGIIFNNSIDFVVKRCNFLNFGYGAIIVYHKDNLARGLICESTFYHNYKGVNGQQLGYGIVVIGANKQWITEPGFGTSNFIFIENNTFEAHRHAVAGGGCALYVCRYNTFKNNFLEAAIDMHEARGSGLNYYSTRAMEAYNNTFTNTKFRNGSLISSDASPWHVGNDLGAGPFGIRGGEALIHDNNISYCQYGIMLYSIYHYETGASYSYPIPYQIGWASGVAYGSYHTGIDGGRGKGDIFIWNNTFVDYHSRNTLMYISNTTMIKKEREYHLFAKSVYTTFTYPHPLRSRVI